MIAVGYTELYVVPSGRVHAAKLLHGPNHYFKTNHKICKVESMLKVIFKLLYRWTLVQVF